MLTFAADMSKIKFTKMHGAGNDYVYLNCFESDIPADLPGLACEIADRHTGVGGDGLILMLPDHEAHCRMRMFNADGSEGKMCGNGIRCVAKLYHDRVDRQVNPIRIATASGIKTVTLTLDEQGEMTEATVDMGAPILEQKAIPVAEGEALERPVMTATCGEVKVTPVSMGNPHGVIFVNSLDDTPVHALGRELETHAMWPDRANIEMAEVNADGTVIRMRVWERGSGETLACGTGACATAVAAWLTGRSSGPVTLKLLGGDLRIDRTPEGHVLMTGPAVTVFTGTYPRKNHPRQ